MNAPRPNLTTSRIRVLQVTISLLSTALLSIGTAAPPEGSAYDIPKVEASIFNGEALGMMDFERQKLAEHLAAYVVNHLAKGVIAKDPKATDLAERLNGLALHLDVRNRTALVSDFQFRRGLMPKEVTEFYEPSLLAEFLVTRSEFLAKKPGVDNSALAGYLLSLSVEIDPENESAVFQYLMWQRSGNAIDWTPLTGTRKETPRSSP